MARYKRDTKVNNLLITEKTYRVFYRINGRKRELTLGSRDIPINVARNKAQQILGEVAQGIDPLNTRGGETLNQAFEYYIDKLIQNKRRVAMPNKNGKPGDYVRMWDKDVKNDLGKRILTDINRGDITRLHLEISKRGSYTANRVVQMISGCYNHAIALSLVEINPCKIKLNKELISENEISDKEFAELRRQINIKRKTVRPNFVSSLDYIELCMHSGGRCKSEIGSAKWSDLKDNKIVLSEHKTDHETNEDRVIYLSNQAMMVINKLERKGEYILDVDYPVKMWKQLAKKIGRPELRLHDLRHNFCTMAGEIMELPELMKLSGHKSMSAVLRYRKVREPRAIKEMQNVGDYMTKIMMSN